MRFSEGSVDPKRFEEIVRILAKYGLVDWLGKDLPEFIERRFTTQDGRPIRDLPSQVRIREAFTELGTTFIKLGQVLSTRSDLVGEEIAEELTKLQAEVPADSAESVHETIIRELGKSADELYAEFANEPLGSASIAQVHAARLHDGTPVVVKVQHPTAESRAHKDLDILLVLAEKAEQLSPDLRQFQPRSLVAEFRKSLLKEVDFKKEINNLQQVARNLSDLHAVHIPKPFPELSSRRVLTMERIEGYSVARVEQMESEGVDRKKMAHDFADAYVRMILKDGVYHADPHPGNILVLPEDRLGLLDFGTVGRIDERTRDEYVGIVLAAIFGGDADETTDYILRICQLPRNLDRNALRADVGEFMSEYLGQSLNDLDVASVATSANDIIRHHHIIMPTGLSLLFKVLAQVEGTARLMDVDFNLAEALEPYYKESIGSRLAPKKLLRRTRRQLQDWERLLDALPRDLSDMLTQVRQGDFDVAIEHRRLDTIVNRLVTGVLAAALFLGSVQLWSLQVPPMWKGIPVPAVLGMGGAVYLGLRLLRAIRRTGDLGQRR